MADGGTRREGVVVGGAVVQGGEFGRRSRRRGGARGKVAAEPTRLRVAPLSSERDASLADGGTGIVSTLITSAQRGTRTP
jgi:hypothetical protein